MPSLEITGSDPYEVEFKPDAGGSEVVKQWTLQKAANSSCLSVSFTSVAGTEKIGLVLRDIPFPGGVRPVGIPAYVAQKCKVTLECGECTCGDTFSVVIAASYGEFNNAQKIGAMKILTRVLSIACAGPGCTNIMKIANESIPLLLSADYFAQLTPDEVIQINTGLGMDGVAESDEG